MCFSIVQHPPRWQHPAAARASRRPSGPPRGRRPSSANVKVEGHVSSVPSCVEGLGKALLCCKLSLLSPN